MARSTHMELEGLKRGLQRLEDAGLHIQILVTDRHGMVKKFMRTDYHDKKHYFNVWLKVLYFSNTQVYLVCQFAFWLNLLFNLQIRVFQRNSRPMPRKKDCGDIKLWTKRSVNHCYWVVASSGDNGEMKEQKWTSLVEHVANKHDNCQYGELDKDRQWLREGKTNLL